MDTNRPKLKQPIPGNAEKVFEGKLFSVFQWPQKLYNGKIVTFEALSRPDSVNVLPITADNKIILAEQQQPGMKPFIGALGGRVDEGEDPLVAAKRELLEESGLIAEEYILWQGVHIAEKLDWVLWTFVAKQCTPSVQNHVNGGEKIKLIEVTFDEYMTIIAQENYRDSDIAFELLKLQARGELDQVRSLWLN